MLQTNIRDYHVIYHSPGTCDRSAMPLGNGEMCVSVWCEGKDTLCIYLSRSDALTEIERTVKLGLIRLQFDNPVFFASNFRQELSLEDGTIYVSADSICLSIFVSRLSDALYIRGNFPHSQTVRVEYVNWRTEDGPAVEENGGVRESADIVREEMTGTLFYHHNTDSLVPWLADLQDLGDCKEYVPDYLKDRYFGGRMRAKFPFSREGKWLAFKDIRELFLTVTTTAGQYPNEAAFLTALEEEEKRAANWDVAHQETAAWWDAYWEKSYIYVEGDIPRSADITQELRDLDKETDAYSTPAQSAVTLAYVLTKYMTACCSEGKFPILYNGMLFNLMPGLGLHFQVNNFGRCFTGKPQGPLTISNNPDERSWCREHLWQNLRHPYLSMLARGEVQPFHTLFTYFRPFHELNRLRAARYYGAQGEHSTEMALTCGLQSGGIYGTDRRGRAPGDRENRWGGAVDVSPGLELLQLMLDYADFTHEERFLRQEVLPYARALFQYVETRFPGRRDGKMVLAPLHSVETYHDTENPITVIAGLRAVNERILRLPDNLLPDKDYFLRYSKQIPDWPCGQTPEGIPVFLPAERYENKRLNVEFPQLYAVMPFRCFAPGTPGYEQMLATYRAYLGDFGLNKPFTLGETPSASSYSGWQYISVCAALLGLTEDAATMLEHNCALKNPGTRFPAMWGPCYDAVPDTDHGANILATLQAMVMQVIDGTVHLLPAFPKTWNVAFRLHVDKDTVVEGIFRDGRWESLHTTGRKHTIVLDKDGEKVLC